VKHAIPWIHREQARVFEVGADRVERSLVHAPGPHIRGRANEQELHAALARWENEGGTPSGDGGSTGPSAARAHRRIERALLGAWRERAGRLGRVLGLALVAVVCGLRGRAAYRAWQRRRPTVLRRVSSLRPRWARD
jgi:hypothetical protein